MGPHIGRAGCAIGIFFFVFDFTVRGRRAATGEAYFESAIGRRERASYNTESAMELNLLIAENGN